MSLQSLRHCGDIVTLTEKGLEPKIYGKSLYTDSDFDPFLYVLYSDLIKYHGLSFSHHYFFFFPFPYASLGVSVDLSLTSRFLTLLNSLFYLFHRNLILDFIFYLYVFKNDYYLFTLFSRFIRSVLLRFIIYIQKGMDPQHQFEEGDLPLT